MKSDHMPELLRLTNACSVPCILCETPTKYRGQWHLSDPTKIGLLPPPGGGAGRVIYALCADHAYDEHVIAIVEELIKNKVASRRRII